MPRHGIRRGDLLRLKGVNFGAQQTTGEVYLGSKQQYCPTSCFGKDCYGGNPLGGKLQATVKTWTENLIKVRAKFNETKWGGKKKYVWVVRDGLVSNAKRVKIISP
jgi:hypothetical protein